MEIAPTTGLHANKSVPPDCGGRSLNAANAARMKAGRSSGLRLVTRFSSVTASLSTYWAPALMRSLLRQPREASFLTNRDLIPPCSNRASKNFRPAVPQRLSTGKGLPPANFHDLTFVSCGDITAVTAPESSKAARHSSSFTSSKPSVAYNPCPSSSRHAFGHPEIIYIAFRSAKVSGSFVSVAFPPQNQWVTSEAHRFPPGPKWRRRAGTRQS